MTWSQAQAITLPIGIVIRSLGGSGNYSVKYRDDDEGIGGTYYTDDLNDAVETGELMARDKAGLPRLTRREVEEG